MPEQPLRGRLDTDVSTRAAAVVSEVAVWGLGPRCAAAAGIDSRGRAGKVATSPQRTPGRDGERGRPWLQPVISGCIVMLFLCASLFYVITKIILCQWDCVCDCVCVCVCVCVVLCTGSSGDVLTQPTIDITMRSYRASAPRPLQHTWKTTIVVLWPFGGYTN